MGCVRGGRSIKCHFVESSSPSLGLNSIDPQVEKNWNRQDHSADEECDRQAGLICQKPKKDPTDHAPSTGREAVCRHNCCARPWIIYSSVQQALVDRIGGTMDDQCGDIAEHHTHGPSRQSNADHGESLKHPHARGRDGWSPTPRQGGN